MRPIAICPKCSAKVRPDRDRCPRCRAYLTAPDPALSAAASRRLMHGAAILVGLFVLTVAVLWLSREAEPVLALTGPIADPLAARRSTTPAVLTPVEPAREEPAARPFLEAAGAGSLAYEAGDYNASLARYLEAVEKNPDDAESLSNLGQVLVRLNRPAEALPYFERAVAIIPGRWAYHFNLARALGLLNRHEEAVAGYRHAQQLFPDDYVTAFNLAMALHRKGDEAAAVQEYQRAIALQPEDASFRIALGISYERLQKPGEAAAAYEQYLRLAPAAPDADKVRARIAHLQGGASAETPAQLPGALVN